MNKHILIALGVAAIIGVSSTIAEKRTSTNGINLIKKFESLKLKKYMDAAGLPTIGYGHLIKPNEFFTSDGITRRQAEVLLRQDLRVAEDAIKRLVKAPLTQNQFDALVSLVFNIGAGAFKKSTLLKRLNEGDIESAASEFPRWNKAGGRVLAGLLKRRALEQNLFLTR